MWIPGAATHVEAESLSEPSLVVVTSPVLLTTPLPPGQTPPVAAVVGEVMCTLNVEAAWVVPAGTVTGPQVNLPAAIAQAEFQPAPCDAIDQDRPALTGKVSDSVTPCASPVPSLYTVSVKPIGSPALTLPTSGVFTMWIEAGLTTTGSSSQPLSADRLFESPSNEATQ